eukprot:c22335_g1_i2 orf=27-773(+)
MALSDCELDSILRDFDVLHQEYKDWMSEIVSVKLKLAAEVQRRESAESTCSGLEKDKLRLMKVQEEILGQMAQQIEYRTKYEALCEQLKSYEEQFRNKENAHKDMVANVVKEHNKEIGILQNQIRQYQEQLALKDAAMAQLEEEIAHFHSVTDALRKGLQQTQTDAEKKYSHDIEDLQKRLKMELDGKQKLHEDMQRVENSFLIARMKYEEQLRELSSNRHAEAFKQKIMRLRKENEDLKRRLVPSQH